MTGPRHLTPVLEAAAAGLLPRQIAAQAGISVRTVFNYMRRFDVRPGRSRNAPRLSAEQRRAIADAYLAGEPTTAIARRYRVSDSYARILARRLRPDVALPQRRFRR